MKTAEEARNEALKRAWKWVVYDPDNWRWGYARRHIPGREFHYLMYFESWYSPEDMEDAVRDHFESMRTW